MYWNRKDRPSGGTWQCAVKQAERSIASYWRDPVAWCRRQEDRNRRRRIARLEEQLKETIET